MQCILLQADEEQAILDNMKDEEKISTNQTSNLKDNTSIAKSKTSNSSEIQTSDVHQGVLAGGLPTRSKGSRSSVASRESSRSDKSENKTPMDANKKQNDSNQSIAKKSHTSEVHVGSNSRASPAGEAGDDGYAGADGFSPEVGFTNALH